MDQDELKLQEIPNFSLKIGAPRTWETPTTHPPRTGRQGIPGQHWEAAIPENCMVLGTRQPVRCPSVRVFGIPFQLCTQNAAALERWGGEEASEEEVGRRRKGEATRQSGGHF